MMLRLKGPSFSCMDIRSSKAYGREPPQNSQKSGTGNPPSFCETFGEGRLPKVSDRYEKNGVHDMGVGPFSLPGISGFNWGEITPTWNFNTLRISRYFSKKKLFHLYKWSYGSPINLIKL